DETSSKLLAQLGYRIHATHLLHTDNGTFVVAVASALDGGFPDRFALINTSDRLVSELQFLTKIRENIAALQELDPILPIDARVLPIREARVDVPGGLITASDWLDFRHPAGPEFFIGRREALEN